MIITVNAANIAVESVLVLCLMKTLTSSNCSGVLHSVFGAGKIEFSQYFWLLL